MNRRKHRSGHANPSNEKALASERQSSVKQLVAHSDGAHVPMHVHHADQREKRGDDDCRHGLQPSRLKVRPQDAVPVRNEHDDEQAVAHRCVFGYLCFVKPSRSTMCVVNE